jgi:hypothetical protein
MNNYGLSLFFFSFELEGTAEVIILLAVFLDFQLTESNIVLFFFDDCSEFCQDYLL